MFRYGFTNYRGSAATGGGSASSPLLTDLVSYWGFDESSAGSAPVTRVDSLAVHNLTDNNNIPSATGVINNGAALTGTSSHYFNTAKTAALVGGDRDWCFDGWFKLADRTATQYLISKGISRSNLVNYDYHLFAATSSVSFRVSNGSAIATVNIGATPVNDTWTYFYIQHDATNNQITGALNNAALVSPISFTASAAHDPDGDLVFGRSASSDLYMTGGFDEIGRWNRLLTETERLDRWNSGSGLAYPF